MQRLPFRHAVALGLLHGPSELLPISSSGHTTLVPWLAGWPYGELDPESRKSFEVALHAGTAAALLLRPPSVGIRGRASLLLPAVVPPALAGYGLGGLIERRLGTPTSILAGLLGGSIAMLVADLGAGSSRTAADAALVDGLLLGLAQALALIPGVSRSGATIAAARGRGFSRRDADRLSWQVGLPVIAGAVLLKGTRLIGKDAREETPRGLRARLAAGGASAFLSTLASTKVLGPEQRGRLLPACAAYRGALALLVIRRMRDNTGQDAILRHSRLQS